jgi:hypothetical protein
MRLSSIVSCALASSVTLLAYVGCSRDGSQQHALPATPQSQSGQASLFVPLAKADAPNLIAGRMRGCPSKRVYVGNFGSGTVSSGIDVFPADWSVQPAPCAQIVRGVFTPSGISVDKNGTLYVSDFFFSAITEYPKDSLVPSATILLNHAPQFAYAGVDGTLYVPESFSNQVEIFPRGATMPNRTLSVPNPYGVATDSANNLYVISDTPNISAGRVIKFAPGSSIGTDLGITLGGGTFSIVIASDNRLVVAQGTTIAVFAPGATVPSRSFPTPGVASFQIVLSSDEKQLFTVSDSSEKLAVYDFASGTQINSFGTGFRAPDGIAFSPRAPY